MNELDIAVHQPRIHGEQDEYHQDGQELATDYHVEGKQHSLGHLLQQTEHVDIDIDGQLEHDEAEGDVVVHSAQLVDHPQVMTMPPEVSVDDRPGHLRVLQLESVLANSST